MQWERQIFSDMASVCYRQCQCHERIGHPRIVSYFRRLTNSLVKPAVRTRPQTGKNLSGGSKAHAA